VYQAAFDRWPPHDIDVPPLDHLRWKMETEQGEALSPHDVVIADGEIAATWLAWLGRGKIGNQTFLTDRAVDLAVHPNHQGKRFARLISEPSEVRNEGRSNYFGLDTSPVAPPVLHMIKDTGVARAVEVWDRPLQARRLIAELRHREGQRYLGRQMVRGQVKRRVLNRLTRRHRVLRSAARRIQVAPVPRFDERADALWDAVSASFDIARIRDAQWLNWRYADPRAGRIVTLGAFDGSQLVGYLAVRNHGRDARIRVASVLDVLSHPERPEAVTALVVEAGRRMSADGSSRLAVWCAPAHPYGTAFEAAGITHSGALVTVNFRTNQLGESPDALAILEDPASTMHVTLGDFDWA
jgi:hypothetical protein